MPEKDGDLLLAGSSVGSSKSRHGGSVYDLLVAEIKVRIAPACVLRPLSACIFCAMDVPLSQWENGHRHL